MNKIVKYIIGIILVLIIVLMIVYVSVSVSRMIKNPERIGAKIHTDSGWFQSNPDGIRFNLEKGVLEQVTMTYLGKSHPGSIFGVAGYTEILEVYNWSSRIISSNCSFHYIEKNSTWSDHEIRLFCEYGTSYDGQHVTDDLADATATDGRYKRYYHDYTKPPNEYSHWLIMSDVLNYGYVMPTKENPVVRAVRN